MQWLNKHAGLLFLAGLIAVILRQWHLWQEDKQRLAHIQAAPWLPPLETWPRLPKVSALVAAWNEAGNIEAHIQSFLRLRYPHKQLVLVAGGSDGTLELARAFSSSQVVVIPQLPGEGKQRALRKGLDLTDGDVIYLTDADCLLDDRSLEMLIYLLVIGSSKVATGVSHPYCITNPDPFITQQWATQFYAQNYYQPIISNGLFGRNCAITKELLSKCWEVNREVRTGTDYFLALRVRELSETIRYLRFSSVATSYPVTNQAYIAQQVRWIKNLLVLGISYRDYDQVLTGIMGVMSGLVLLVSPLLLLFGWIGIGILIFIWAYVLISRLRFYQFLKSANNIIRKNSPRNILRLLLLDISARSIVIPVLIVKSWRNQW
jgi:glycosyltransferase involved in cell wall biosynthesis